MILYRGPIIDSIRLTSKNYTTYMYCFDYRGEHHRFSHLRNPLPFEIDATLSDDNIFLFPYPLEVSVLNPEDKSMSRAMVTMWFNFAQYGVPNLNAGIWPNVSSEYGPFLRFTNTQESKLELDYHFGEGIPVPNLYPEYFNVTKVNTISASKTVMPTTTTMTLPSNFRVNYPQQDSRTSYPNYGQYPYYNTRSQATHLNYKSDEPILNGQRKEILQPYYVQNNYSTNLLFNN